MNRWVDAWCAGLTLKVTIRAVVVEVAFQGVLDPQTCPVARRVVEDALAEAEASGGPRLLLDLGGLRLLTRSGIELLDDLRARCVRAGGESVVLRPARPSPAVAPGRPGREESGVSR